MLEADKFEFGAQDKVFLAILGQLGSNLEAQDAPGELTQNLQRAFWANLAPTWKPQPLQNRGQNVKKSMLKSITF